MKQLISKAFLLLICLFMVGNLGTLQEAMADSVVKQRKKCKNWRKHKIKGKIKEYKIYYVPGYWETYVDEYGNIYQYYVPGYWTGSWVTVKKDKQKGCPTASMNLSYSSSNGNASVVGYVNNNTINVTATSNSSRLKAGNMGPVVAPNLSEADGLSDVNVTANVEIGEDMIFINDVEGRLVVANNSAFDAVFQVIAYTSSVSDAAMNGMEEATFDEIDDQDVLNNNFYIFEVKIIDGRLFVNGEFGGDLALQTTGQGSFVDLSSLNLQIPIPANFNSEGVSVQLLADSQTGLTSANGGEIVLPETELPPANSEKIQAPPVPKKVDEKSIPKEGTGIIKYDLRTSAFVEVVLTTRAGTPTVLNQTREQKAGTYTYYVDLSKLKEEGYNYQVFANGKIIAKGFIRR